MNIGIGITNGGIQCTKRNQLYPREYGDLHPKGGVVHAQKTPPWIHVSIVIGRGDWDGWKAEKRAGRGGGGGRRGATTAVHGLLKAF